MENNLRLIVLDNIKEFGEMVNRNLWQLRDNKASYTVSVSVSRFSNGEGKARIEETVREKDVYIISDVGNYSQKYMLHGYEHRVSPDEHFQDIKRVISATCGHASKITLIMPLLYQSRQHKRKGSESLDCAIALQELEELGVNNIITFDAHDPNVSNAIPKLPFENVYPTHVILKTILDDEPDCMEDILVVSPDSGAMERARYYADMLGCDVGMSYKRRDLSRVVNGKNPILAHEYMGADVKGRNILIVDDMIASGQSMIEVAQCLRKRGAKKIYMAATFALFTEGINSFISAYENGVFDKLYSTNLSYIPEHIKEQKWYVDVDCSMQLAKIINALNSKKSLRELFDGEQQMLQIMKR